MFTKITPTQNMTILVESFWGKLQNFRCVVTRYDKLISRFKTFVYLACVMILLK